METKTININSTTIEYYLSTGKNETVVLVNGAGGPIFGWYKIVDELSSKYNVLAYNRPGIGKSSRPTTPQRFSQTADDLLVLLNQLHISEKIILVGHSLGGLIAQQFCISHPERVKALILIEPSTILDIIDNKKLPFDRKEHNSELNYAKEGALQLKDRVFPNIPVVICVGVKKSIISFFFKKEFATRRKNLDKLSKQIKDSEIIEFEKSGHFPQFTEPAKVVEVIFSKGNQNI